MPEDLDWVVDDILEGLDDSSVRLLDETPSADDMVRFGWFLGMNIRNHYGLWQDSQLAQWFKDNLGLYHPDDMSMVIEHAVWHKSHGVPFDPAPLVETFREHWKEYGVGLDQKPLDVEK